MFNVDGYRKKYREANIKSWYVKLFNFAALNVIFIAALGVFFSILSSPTLWEWLAIPLAFLFANLVEYLLHKYPMHKKYKYLGFIYKQHTSEHHLFFTEERMMVDKLSDIKSMIAPWWFYFVFLAMVAPIAAVGLLVSTNFALLVYSTFVCYYWFFEVFHMLAHISPWFSKTFANHHKIHHDLRRMRKINFNVAFPIFDYIFKTKE
jgi:sterol desaturase/sphingolipid hydroxylase (fatty acid hydroxylase superfamily)